MKLDADDQQTKIQLKEKFHNLLRNRGVNHAAFRQVPYKFQPTSYVAAIEGLKPKSFSRPKQIEMFQSMLDDPFRPVNYAVNSAPDDGKAKLLAAYIMQNALQHHSSFTALPLWVDLTSGFDNPLIKHKQNPSMLIINNVGMDSTPVKLEKLRDILEVYSDIPRITVVTGTDPYTFFMRKLYLPIHGLAYLTNTAVKRFEV
jgi:hypothetical protein